MLFHLYSYFVGFKENLKSELAYQGMLVKELAVRTGVSRHTLDNYLNVRSYIPSAEIAVKIAQALGVSVEYLVTGTDPVHKTSKNAKKVTNSEIRLLIQNFQLLSEKDRKIVSSIVQLFKNHRKSSIKPT
jgi:transcriptional regulator with XRE-family HTH domain